MKDHAKLGRGGCFACKGWVRAAVLIMIALVAMVPAWEQRATGGDPGDGHAYCPVHANPAALDQAPFLRVVLPAHAQALASDPDHLPATGHSIFVPPRS